MRLVQSLFSPEFIYYYCYAALMIQVASALPSAPTTGSDRSRKLAVKPWLTGIMMAMSR